jgi:DNA polymerase I
MYNTVIFSRVSGNQQAGSNLSIIYNQGCIVLLLLPRQDCNVAFRSCPTQATVCFMEMQVIDVDYILVNERPIVRIFGKTEDGKSVCAFYEDYKPYFYTEGEKAKTLMEGEPQVQKIEKVSRKMVMGYQDPTEVYKITITNPARTPELRERLVAAGVATYEADILFKYRFMNDLGIKGLGWIKFKEENGVSTKSVNADRCVRVSSVEPVERLKDVPLSMLAFDIECVPIRPGTIPESGRDPIVLISMVFGEPFKGSEKMVLSTRPGPGVTALSSEKEILERFVEIINQYDPDILTGYNINNFDFPYILDRMREHRIRPVMGRCNQKQVNARKLMARYRVSIIGRIIVDSFEIVKRDYSLTRYGLDFVSGKLLEERKEPVKMHEIENLWKGSQEGFARLVRYSQKDSVLAMLLVQKLNLIDKYVALSKVSGTLLQDTLNSGETTRIENFLLREFNRAGYVLPCKPTSREIARREDDKKRELKGGFVLEPEKKPHSNVVVLDFKSMYPSIIRSFNICPTTIIKDKPVKSPIETVAGTRFAPREVRVGIIPTILERLLESRVDAKKKKARAKDPFKKKAYEAEQWALKIMANAFYGHMGYSRARIYDLDVANTITACGRDIIHKTKDMVEKDYGYKVVYGDTDSVVIKVDTDDLEKTRKIANRISSGVTERLPGIIELEFEKVFKRFLPLTKKRYFAWRFEPREDGWKEGIEMKGIETVRRDWCELVGDTLRDVIDIVLKGDDPMEAVSYFTNIVQRLVKNEISVQKLVVTKTMTKPPEKYEGMQPHIELVKKLRIRNTGEVPGVGDRIGYVIVKGMGLLSKRAEDPTYVEENGIQVDSKYYIENQLLPPMERIFSVLGVSRSMLMGGGRQADLMHIINQTGEKSAAREIPVAEMGGFSCEKCGRFCSRVPLVGSCACGGRFLFSHKGGAAERVVIQIPG